MHHSDFRMSWKLEAKRPKNTQWIVPWKTFVWIGGKEKSPSLCSNQGKSGGAMFPMLSVCNVTLLSSFRGICGLQGKNRNQWLISAPKGCRTAGNSVLPSFTKDANYSRNPQRHFWVICGRRKYRDDGEQFEYCVIWGVLCYKTCGKEIKH